MSEIEDYIDELLILQEKDEILAFIAELNSNDVDIT